MKAIGFNLKLLSELGNPEVTENSVIIVNFSWFSIFYLRPYKSYSFIFPLNFLHIRKCLKANFFSIVYHRLYIWTSNLEVLSIVKFHNRHKSIRMAQIVGHSLFHFEVCNQICIEGCTVVSSFIVDFDQRKTALESSWTPIIVWHPKCNLKSNLKSNLKTL